MCITRVFLYAKPLASLLVAMPQYIIGPTKVLYTFVPRTTGR